jgi:hypothetical protein
MASVDWRAYLPQLDRYEDGRLLDVYVRDAFNRFARKADIVLDDPDGTAPDVYRRGTPVDLEVNYNGTWEQRWSGFVIDPRTEEDQTTVELYGHDFWLRKRNVVSSYDQMTIEAILEDLITRLTPLKWVPELVDVDYTDPIGVSWRGQSLDEVVNELSTYSAQEEFGATNDREFYFQQQDSVSSLRDYGPGDYIEANFGEDGTKEINQVTVYYGEGDNTGGVTVDDRSSQEDLATTVGAEDDRVVLGVTRSYPEIDNEEAARVKAEDILTGRTAIRTGNIQTWDSFEVYPGDVARVDIPEHDVDEDMRVAQIEYKWMDDETNIKFAEADEGVVDALVDLSNEVERVESRGIDETSTITQFLGQDIPLSLDATTIAAYSKTIPDDMFLPGRAVGHEDLGGSPWLGDMSGDRTKVFEIET